MVFENSLHYKTFADRSQVENRIESYDSLIIPSKLMVGGKKAVPPLVYRLVDAGEVSYYVNPSIREFHRGDSFMDGDELKAWHQKLTEELGEPLYSIIDSSFNLSVEELPSEDIREIAQSVVEFQENVVMDAVSESMDKYEQALADNIRPRAIVPWYQKISDYEHINQNREILEYSQLTDLPIKPCIHAEVDFLRDATARAQIIEMLSINENKECFVWIDGLKKSDTSVDEYIDVLRFISDLSTNGYRPHFLYGDFFSNLLSYFGLAGTGFGTYHSESHKEKLETVGGGNLQRYYLNPTKEFFGIADAYQLATNNEAPVPGHSGLGSWRRLPKLGEDHDFLKNHFIRTKLEHKMRVMSEPLSKIKDELISDYLQYQDDVNELQSEKSIDHLEKWVNAIAQFEESYNEEYTAALSAGESLRRETVI